MKQDFQGLEFFTYVLNTWCFEVFILGGISKLGF